MKSDTKIRFMPRERSLQRGFTLLEFLIAMTVGVFLIAGVATLFFSSSQTSRLSQKVSSTTEGGQIVVFMMRDAVRLAGYGEICCSNPAVNANQTLFSGDPLRVCPAGQKFADPAAVPADFSCVADASALGDTLMVQFQGDTVLRPVASQNVIQDCIGGSPVIEQIPVASGHQMAGVQRGMVRNVYSLTNVSAGKGDLACTGSSAPAAPQAMIGNVEDFRVYFGFDADFDNTRPAEISAQPLQSQIVDATGLTALAAADANAWRHVVAVYVCFRIQTSEQGAAPSRSVKSEACPDASQSGGLATAVLGDPVVTTQNDGITRRTFREVFTIRAQAAANPV